MSSPVAIIMRAKNEMPHVQRTLDMLQRQTFRDSDFFAVDSGSSDGSYEALQHHCTTDRLTRIAAEAYAPGRVLNNAIAQTDHDIIVLLNADAVPAGEVYLERLLAPLLEDRADIVFARQTARSDAYFIVRYDYERAFNPDTMEEDFFSAVACAFKRGWWERHRFRDQGYAEDLEWARSCLAEGARIRFIPEAVVEHSHNYTLGELYRKRRRQAATFGEAPGFARQVYRCSREIIRDLLRACRTLKLHTIPYNMAYRITIHAAIYHGLKEGM